MYSLFGLISCCNLIWVKSLLKDRIQKYRIRTHPFGLVLSPCILSLPSDEASELKTLFMLHHPNSDMMWSLVATLLNFTRCEVIAFWSRVLGGWSELIRNWDCFGGVRVPSFPVSHCQCYAMKNLQLLCFFSLSLLWKLVQAECELTPKW